MLLSIFSLLLHLSDPHTPMPGTMPMPGKPAMQCKSFLSHWTHNLNHGRSRSNTNMTNGYYSPLQFCQHACKQGGCSHTRHARHGAHAHHVVAISRHHHARHCCHHAHASMHSRLNSKPKQQISLMFSLQLFQDLTAFGIFMM